MKKIIKRILKKLLNRQLEKRSEAAAQKAAQKAAALPLAAAKPIREKAEPVFDEVKTRAAKATEKTEVFLQFGDHEMRVDDIVEKAREDYYARGGDRHALKVMRVYLKPEDHTAYYVANNDETGKVGF